MKTVLLALSMFILSTVTSIAQEMSIGPNIFYKAGVSAVETPKDRKNGVAPSEYPDFKLVFHYPFNDKKSIGITTDIGLSNFSYLMVAYETNDKVTVNHSYFTINPNLNFGGFLLGLEVGIPISSNFDGKEIKTSIQKITADVTIGGMIPIFTDDIGVLNLIIFGTYNFTGVYKDFVKDDPMQLSGVCPVCPSKLNASNNPRPASLGLGFSFLFNLMKAE